MKVFFSQFQSYYRSSIRRFKHFFNFLKFNYKTSFKNKYGLEIGGPSKIFQYELPVYQLANKIDGVNYSHKTLWEGSIEDKGIFNYFKNKKGIQFIAEANELRQIADETYDFIISSHCLEHCANPISVILEWKRVLKKQGVMFILVPDKNFTFDHKRLVTTFDHLMNDFQVNTAEDDLTHLEEILELHDLDMDLPAGNKENFRQRSLDNLVNRCLHQHVFSPQLLEKVFNFCNLKVIKTWSFGSLHHAIIGRKT